MNCQYFFTIVTLLLCNQFSSLHSISCERNSIGIDWTGSSSSATGSSSSTASWQSASYSDECDGVTTCVAAEYSIDFLLTVSSIWFNWEWTWDGSFDLSAAFCGNDAICDIIAGGDNACRAVDFEFQQWYPRSCRENNDYDATTIDFNITYKYGCCNTDDCNANYNYSICEYNDEFGNYVSGLYECWNDVRKDVMVYLVCDDEGEEVYDFAGNCRYEGAWLDDDDCAYIHECTDDWATVLTNFGECACEAATSNGYSGHVIAEMMETQWSTYCPNINLTCAAEDGSLELWITRWYIYWHFNFAAVVDDYIREEIREAIAEAANVDVDLVVIYNEEQYEFSYDGNDGNGTSVTITIITETEDDSTEVKSNLDNYADAKVVEKTGVNTTNGTAEVEETTEDFYNNAGIFHSVMSSVVTVAVIASLVTAIGF